jgi:hypothetical protein
MQENHSKIIEQLKVKFDRLCEDLDNSEALYKFQVAILDQVIDCERELRVAKERGDDLEELRFTRFIFRSFGDAIAFAYVSSHNLKQLSFNLEKGTLKQDSGFICGKEGLESELHKLKSLINEGIPCLLCDITNSVRYGDILVLCANDPYVIECKTSSTTSRRVTKQKRTLRTLQEFYEKDEKTMKIDDASVTVVRVEIESQDHSYIQEINLLIEEAQKSGSASARIENGLWYMVFRADLDVDLPEIMGTPQKLLFFWLNDYKNNNEWISYIPFVSSIKGSKNLLDFIEGNLLIAVAIGIDSLGEVANINGLRFEMKEDNPEFPFWFYPLEGNPLDEKGFAISAHYIQRIPLEFRSLNKMLASAKKHYFG